MEDTNIKPTECKRDKCNFCNPDCELPAKKELEDQVLDNPKQESHPLPRTNSDSHLDRYGGSWFIKKKQNSASNYYLMDYI